MTTHDLTPLSYTLLQQQGVFLALGDVFGDVEVIDFSQKRWIGLHLAHLRRPQRVRYDRSHDFRIYRLPKTPVQAMDRQPEPTISFTEAILTARDTTIPAPNNTRLHLGLIVWDGETGIWWKMDAPPPEKTE